MTGSSRGIGAAIALRLASHGADVVINYHSSPAGASAIAEQARALGVKAISVQADVSKAAEIEGLFKAAQAEFGRVDIVMSNSGIEHFGELESVTGEEIDKVLAVNVKAQFMVAQQAHKYLSDNGRLILISSISAVTVSMLRSPLEHRCIHYLGPNILVHLGHSEPRALCRFQGCHPGNGQMSSMGLWQEEYHGELYCPRRGEDRHVH